MGELVEVCIGHAHHASVYVRHGSTVRLAIECATCAVCVETENLRWILAEPPLCGACVVAKKAGEK